MEAQPSPRKTLIHVSSDRTPCGPRQSLRVPEIYLGNTDHLGISGPNGAGKTTLVKHILEILEGRKATGLTFARCISLRKSTIHPQLNSSRKSKDLPKAERGAPAFDRCATQFGSRTNIVRREHQPGELRKLMLARGILDAPKSSSWTNPRITWTCTRWRHSSERFPPSRRACFE